MATAAAATDRTSRAASMRSTPSLIKVASGSVTWVSWGSVTPTGADAGGGAGPETAVAGLAVIDAVASLLPRRQRSKSTAADGQRARITIATQIGKPESGLEPPGLCEPSALVDAALVGGSGWPTHGGVRWLASATGAGKLSARVAGALTSSVVVPDSAV